MLRKETDAAFFLRMSPMPSVVTVAAGNGLGWPEAMDYAKRRLVR